MAFIRNLSREKFTVIDNTAVRDKNLSLKSLGLLVKLLSLPDNWQFSEKGLESAFEHDGQASIRTGLKELETYGYLRRVKRRDEMGHIVKIEWIISERPQLRNPQLGNPSLDNPKVDNPSLGNHPQLNTNTSNTDKRSTKESNTDRAKPTRHKYGEYSNVLLSDEDMEKLKAEFPSDWKERIERLSEYMASTGKSYKNHLATIRTWARKDRQKQTQQEEEGNPFLAILREEQERKYGSGRDSEDYVTL